MPIEVKSYLPTPKQKEFHSNQAKFRAFLGGFGSGKTLSGVWEAIDLSMRYKNNSGVICRKTYQELCDTTRKTFKEQCPPELIDRWIASENRVVFINGSEIAFRSLDDPSKIRSLNLGWFYIDEADEVAEEYFLMLQGRLRNVNVIERKGFLTTNPPSVTHWIYKYFVEKVSNDPSLRDLYALIKASCYDNPYLPKEYIDNLVREYPPSWVKRYVMGEFGLVVNGDPVFTSFTQRNKIEGLYKNYIKDRTILRGWDFGWHHPAVVFTQYDIDDRLNVLRSIMGTKIYLNEFADGVIRRSNEWFPQAEFIDYCDIAGKQKTDKAKQTSIEILNSKGIHPYCRKSNNTKAIEIIERMLRTMIGDKPQLCIDPLNTTLIEAFEGGYCYERNLEGIPSREPMKDGWYEHLVDGLKYIIINREMNAFSSVKDYKSIEIKSPKWSGTYNG